MLFHPFWKDKVAILVHNTILRSLIIDLKRKIFLLKNGNFMGQLLTIIGFVRWDCKKRQER